MRLSLAVLATLVSVGCGQTDEPSPTADDLDPFILMTNAERRAILVERAIEGVDLAPVRDPDTLASDAERADAALKRAGLAFVTLRARACQSGLAAAEVCDGPPLPDWVFEAPTASTSPEILFEREAFIARLTGPLVEIGCAAGVAATSEELFCSVE
jgi:hypothetical protein